MLKVELKETDIRELREGKIIKLGWCQTTYEKSSSLLLVDQDNEVRIV